MDRQAGPTPFAVKMTDPTLDAQQCVNRNDSWSYTCSIIPVNDPPGGRRHFYHFF